MERTEQVVFCGDFVLSCETTQSEFYSRIVNPWSNLRGVFGTDSAIIANLECPFTHESNGFPFKWVNLKTSPELHTILDGLSMVTMGNNHMGDFGPQGVRDTQALLANKGITFVGYGESLDDALKPAFVNIGKKRLGVVSLCCPTTNSENLATHLTPGVAPLGMATLKQAVEGARSKCDALAVYLHWGREWVHDPAPDQLRLARYAIDCGADAVIGCHSHTIQSYEQYRGCWIFYGLGNYLFKAEYCQSAGNNGVVDKIPLTTKPSNQESLAVSFKIISDNSEGRLALGQIQYMRFGDDLIPIPIAMADLSFDLAAANRRLRRYSALNDELLNDRSEPIFCSRLRNGILMYSYSDESINKPLWEIASHLIKSFTRKSVRFLKRNMRHIANKFQKGLLMICLAFKWIYDKQHLPLTVEHRELYDTIHRLCRIELGRFPNLIDCRDFNDRIQWLKLFDQSEEIVRCSDKILVRDYIRERVGEKYLLKLYQVHDHFYEIDFDALPNSFVIKTNHDSGTVIMVRDKAKLNFMMANDRVESALKRPYGWANGEWAYSYIQPKVFVEEFINPTSYTPPPDYKFYCIEGVVKFVHFIYDRGYDTKEQTVDPQGNDMATELYPSFKLSNVFIKPARWNEMISVAERLGKGFKCVRIDLFCFDEKVFTGEMTFWPMAGCYKGEGQRKLGNLLDFDRTTFKPLVHPQLKRFLEI